jgi:transposase
MIALEVGDVSRFATAEKLAAYGGSTPRIYAAVGRRGSDHLVRTLPEVAVCRSRERDLPPAWARAACHVSRRYERVARRRGHAKAIGAGPDIWAKRRIGS